MGARFGSVPRLDVMACVVVCSAAMRTRLTWRSVERSLGKTKFIFKMTVVGAVFFATGGVVCAQQQNGSVSEKAVLRGTVVNSVTHQPIGRALVKSTDGRFAVMTNDRGQFEMRFKEKKGGAVGDGVTGRSSIFTSFSGGAGGVTGSPGVAGGASSQIQPGQAQQGQEQQAQGQQMQMDRPDYLTAVRVGYLTPRTPWGNAVQVGRDQEEVTIALTPEAKLIGHVTLADGEGAAGISVELYRQSMQDGRVRWMSAGSAEARSDGEFRFASLEAGIYKLYSAELPDRDPVTSDPRGQGYGYPPDYWPSAGDFAGAAVIRLAAGETFQAALTPEKKRYYPVHIAVANGARGRQLDIEVERDGHPGPGFTLGNDFRDGSIAGMLPDGNYLVRASTQENGGLTGLVNLAVHGGPAMGSVALLPGTDVEVRVIKEFQESEQGQNAQGSSRMSINGRDVPIQLQLVPTEEFNPGQQYMAMPPNDPAGEGLVVSGVAAGEYRVTTQMPGAAYVAAIRSGDRDLQESALVIGGGASVPAIEVTLRNDGAEIDGSIVELANRGSASGSSGSAATGFVYIVPERGGGEMKLVTPQPNGEFQIQQLAPGTYRVLAFERVQDDLEYRDEEAMRKYDAQVVTVVPGQKEKVRVAFSKE